MCSSNIQDPSLVRGPVLLGCSLMLISQSIAVEQSVTIILLLSLLQLLIHLSYPVVEVFDKDCR